MLTVIASMDYELSGLRRELNSAAFADKGEHRDPAAQEGPPDLKVIGVGKERAQASVRQLLEKRTTGSSTGGVETNGLLLLGVAGAVDPALHTGDLVLSSRYFKFTQGIGAWGPNLAESAADRAIEGPLTPDPDMWELATKACAGEGRKPAYMDSLTVDRVVSDPDQKRAIAAAYPVGIVEMEDYWVAELAAEFGVAFLAARVVLDTVDQALPEWLLGLSRSRLKAVWSLAGKPWRIPTVARLVRQRPVAQKSLTSFALKFLAEAANAKDLAPVSTDAGRDSLRVLA